MSMRRIRSLEDGDDNNVTDSLASSPAPKKRSQSNMIILIMLVTVWYLTAVIAITTSKEVMNRAKFPFLLCTIQFLFATLIAYFFLYLTKAAKPIPPSITSILYQISFTYTLGFVFTNSAFSMVSPAFAETIKSSEPLTTVVLGYLVLNESSSIRTYLTLIPICFGIAISCYHNDSFHFGGMILAALSNVCFSGRAVLAKKLNLQFPEGIDDIQMFANISQMGLYLLIPITVLFEGNALYTFLQTGPNTSPAVSGAAVGAGIGAGKEENSTFLLCFFLVINGLVFACYNLVSYLVLRRTDLITHSVFNAFRRVFIIIFTTLYFGFPLSQNNIVGISIAVVGVLLFGYYRSTDKVK